MCEPDAFKTEQRKARVSHKCCECGKTIEPGELYQYSSGIWDSEPCRYKQCSNCYALFDAAGKFADDEGIKTMCDTNKPTIGAYKSSLHEIIITCRDDFNENIISVDMSKKDARKFASKLLSLTNEEEIDDALLNAAAPEMYEMLEFLVNNDSINDPSIDKEVTTLLARARRDQNA